MGAPPAAVDVIAHRGDILLYGAGPRATRAQRAEVATVPGGVPFAGRLFCAAHAPAGSHAPYPCPQCLEEVATTAPGGQV